MTNTENKKVHVLWEDNEHAQHWSVAFHYLRKRNFEVTVLRGLGDEDITNRRLALLANADIWVIHSGSTRPPDLSPLIKEIRELHPNLIVLLQSEAVHELTRPYVHGFITWYDLLELDKLEGLLRTQVRADSEDRRVDI